MSRAVRPSSGTAHPVWITAVVAGLVIGIAFVGVYVGLQRNPTPRDLPLAATGDRVVAAARATGPAASVTVVATVAAGRRLVRGGDAVAVLSSSPSSSLSSSPGVLRVDYAGARGLTETAAALAVARTVADALHLRVDAADVVPLAKADTRGLASFYVVFGVTLSSFVLAQSLTGAASAVRLRHRLWVVLGFAAAIGLSAAAVAGPIMHALPASFPALAATLVLLSAATALAAKASTAWLGRFGNAVSVLVLTVIGNATSGASIGYDLLPGWAQALSPVLPAGAAFRAVTEFGYFGGHAAVSLTVLAGWALVALLLVLLRPLPADSPATPIERTAK